MADVTPDPETPRKLVRITGERNGIIEFEYAIGDLSLALELMLPPAAFEEFCRANAVELVSDTRVIITDEGQRAMAWLPSDVRRGA